MKIYIKNLYGINNGYKAFYRKQGICCYDFVGNKELASDLTEEEAAAVLSHSDFYKKQYNADEMGIEAETA